MFMNRDGICTNVVVYHPDVPNLVSLEDSQEWESVSVLQVVLGRWHHSGALRSPNGIKGLGASVSYEVD